MKKVILFILSIFSLSLQASDEPKFSIKVIDYSLSWTNTMHYSFENEGMSVVEVDNIDVSKKDTLSHRQLFGKEKELIIQYLTIMSSIDFDDKYINRFGGERNQKRISLEFGEMKKNIFISNLYQEDIASFITFLNSFIVEKNKMKEFTNPNKPQKEVVK